MAICKFPGCNEDTEAVSGLCIVHECVAWSWIHGDRD